MRLIDADALISYTREAYCKNCERRKGTKNGKVKFVYEIGGAPCRACGTGDMLDALEDAPTVKPCACGTCMHGIAMGHGYVECNRPAAGVGHIHKEDWYCADWC